MKLVVKIIIAVYLALLGIAWQTAHTINTRPDDYQIVITLDTHHPRLGSEWSIANPQTLTPSEARLYY
jgi:hypothetical protein